MISPKPPEPSLRKRRTRDTAGAMLVSEYLMAASKSPSPSASPNCSARNVPGTAGNGIGSHARANRSHTPRVTPCPLVTTTRNSPLRTPPGNGTTMETS